MDSREKIIPVETLDLLLREGKWVVLAGAFDPLTAEQALRIAAATSSDRRLAVLVEIGTESLLPAEARAVLVAALRGVDAVAVVRDLPSLPEGIILLRDPEAERRRTQAFTQFVIARQAGAAG